ncbi:MAG: hypothetical protein S4CHLAM20_08680 [Chlamydiia bacterium]|nr:hypothetical protein [Chlamydiia bacterium]
MKRFIILLSCLGGLFASSAKPITIIKAPITRYNAQARLKITSPQVLKKNSPVLILVSNFPIGVDSESRVLDDNGVNKSKAGSRVLLMFSNGMRVYVTKDDVNLLLTQRNYFNKRFRVKIPQNIYSSIEEENFLIYSMLVNCYGESIKDDNAFYTDVYCYNHEKQGIRVLEKELKSPFIVYNEPTGTITGSGVLLDFFVRNVIISSTEHKVDVYIDGNKIDTLKTWQPYVIHNLPKGKHDIRIELVDSSGKIVKNPVSVNSSTIYIK